MWPIRGPMESSHITFRENGNKMICQAEIELEACQWQNTCLVVFFLLEILPFSCIRNKFSSWILGLRSEICLRKIMLHSFQGSAALISLMFGLSSLLNSSLVSPVSMVLVMFPCHYLERAEQEAM